MGNNKILIVGNNYALTKHLKQSAAEIFVVPGDKNIAKIASCVDIREDNPEELLKFVLENEINLTIAISEKAILSDISDIFQNNECAIFAPTKSSAEFVMNKSIGKKLLYKMHTNTPKFGIFEKMQLASDYIKNANFPIIISTDKLDSTKYLCTTAKRAKYHIENLFLQGENKIVIEEFVYGTQFSMYAISDGYHAIPIETTRDFKFSENGDGGILTQGVGVHSPFGELSQKIKSDIFNNVILKALNQARAKGTPYLGILGIDAVLTKDNYSILNFKPFFQNIDSQAILNSIDENIFKLFMDCAKGFFADEYENLMINDKFSVSALLKLKKDKENIEEDNLESEITYINNDIILTSNAKTLSRAKQILTDDIQYFTKDKYYYRSDIFLC